MHNDTSLFPPRCCDKPLPIEFRRERVPKGSIKEFDIRVEELSASNRTYCSNVGCSKFIQERRINGTVGTCIYCTTTTCVVCKAEEHQEELCPQDEGTILLQQEAEQRKWRQCTQCKNLVELDTGCFHITYASRIICLHQKLR